MRWASNDFETVASRIDIVRAVAPGDLYTTLPFVRPGGEILLRIASWRQVSRVMRAIEEVEAIGVDPTDAAPDHWRHVHNRLTKCNATVVASDAFTAGGDPPEAVRVCLGGPTARAAVRHALEYMAHALTETPAVAFTFL